MLLFNRARQSLIQAEIGGQRKMRGLGTVTWRAVMLSSSSALSSISSCEEESWPELRAAVTISEVRRGNGPNWRMSCVPRRATLTMRVMTTVSGPDQR
jgi:hypothetical protein